MEPALCGLRDSSGPDFAAFPHVAAWVGRDSAPWEERGREVGGGRCGACLLCHLCFLVSQVGVITPTAQGCRGEHMRPCAVGRWPRGQHSAGDGGGDDGEDGGDAEDDNGDGGDGGSVISDADADALLSGHSRFLPVWSPHKQRSETLSPQDAWAQCSGASLTLPGFCFRTSTGCRRRSTCSSRRPATRSWSACTPASRRRAGKREPQSAGAAGSSPSPVRFSVHLTSFVVLIGSCQVNFTHLNVNYLIPFTSIYRQHATESRLPGCPMGGGFCAAASYWLVGSINKYQQLDP